MKRREKQTGAVPSAPVEKTVVGIIDDRKEVAVVKNIIVPKDVIIDSKVTVISLDGDKYHKTGTEFELGKKTAEKLAKIGRVKIKE